MPLMSPRLDAVPPVDVRRELAYAVVPPMATAAAVVTTLWLDLFADSTSPAVGAAFVIGFAMSAVGTLAIIVTAYLGRLRHFMHRLVFLVPLVLLLGMSGFFAGLDRLALASRGVEVECEVVAKEDYLRGGGTPRTDHEFACPGWPSFHEDTARNEQFPLHDPMVATLDPLARSGPRIGEVSGSGGIATLLGASGVLAAVTVFRIRAVDDGSIKHAVSARMRRRPN